MKSFEKEENFYTFFYFYYFPITDETFYKVLNASAAFHNMCTYFQTNPKRKNIQKKFKNTYSKEDIKAIKKLLIKTQKELLLSQ